MNRSRVDSYAEGLIDKEDFDPKISQLKIIIQQLERQIEECKQHAVGLHELFLAISRLEDFAATVNDKVDSIDFHTKREIIRAWVKRVEIYKEEVIVVFRVEPESSLQRNNNGIVGIKAEGSIMQDCNGRNRPSLRRTLFVCMPLSVFQNTRLQSVAIAIHIFCAG